MHKLLVILAMVSIGTTAQAGSHCFIKQDRVCTTGTCNLKPVVKKQVVEQKIEQKIVNNTDVINNLIMSPSLAPLYIPPPPPEPLPLTTRPFQFQNNMGPLPQRADPYVSPFVAAGCAPGQVRNADGACVGMQPLLLNNVVTRNIVTSITSSSGQTTTSTSTSGVQINPQTGETKRFVIPDTPEEKSEKTAAPPPPSSTRYGYDQ